MTSYEPLRLISRIWCAAAAAAASVLLLGGPLMLSAMVASEQPDEQKQVRPAAASPQRPAEQATRDGQGARTARASICLAFGVRL